MNKEIENAKRQVKRFLISQQDVFETNEYVHQLLNHELYFPELLSWYDEFVYSDDYVNHRAITTAIVVSYSRPFSSNKNSPSATSTLPLKVLRQYDPKERDLHKKIIEYRNQIYAHSEGEVWEIQLSKMDGSELVGTRVIDPYVSFSKEEILLLLKMIDKIISYTSHSIDTFLFKYGEEPFVRIIDAQ